MRRVRTNLADLPTYLKRRAFAVECCRVTVAGWYGDPAGSGSLRFWDGQAWTAATAPVPAVVGYAPAPAPAPLPAPVPPYPPSWLPEPAKVAYGPPPPPNLPRGGESVAAVIGVIVVAAAIVAAVFMATRDDKSAAKGVFLPPPPAVATSAPAATPPSDILTRSLLSHDQVAAVIQDSSVEDAGAGYSINGAPTDCQGLAYVPGTQRLQASTAFAAGDLTVEESVSSLPGTAQSAVDQFQHAVNSCKTADIDGGAMHVSPVTLPELPGVMSSAGVLMRGEIRGKPFAVEFGMARIGDTVVGLSVFVEGPPNVPGPTFDQLFPVAIDKARTTH